MTYAEIIHHMQQAVEAIPDSLHPTSKVAATLVLQGESLSRANHWPPLIAGRIGTSYKIGNSSGTIHAETAVLLNAPAPTNGGSIFVTDPPCPNCVKNMAEAGIKNLYIDHKGFDKDFARRRGDHFETMSMRICEHAGINVYEVRRKAREIIPIFEAPPDYEPPLENPALIKEAEPESFDELWKTLPDHFNEAPFAAALAQNREATLFLAASPHPVTGYTSATLETPDDKYSFIQQPLNRILMTAAYQGVKLIEGHIVSSRCPTARELVNFIGAGYSQLAINKPDECRDAFGGKALNQLTDNQILVLESPA